MYAKLQQIGKRIQYMQLNYIKINPDFLILRLFQFPLFTRNASKNRAYISKRLHNGVTITDKFHQ